MKRPRTLILTSAICATVVVALCITGFLILRSAWFASVVRLRTIAAIERATGGKVTLQDFQFDWGTLTATFQDLVVRGTEPPSAPPMFQSSSIRIVFPFAALLERQLILRSIEVNGGQIYLLVRPDGSTNLPQIRSDLIRVEDLLSLRIGHFSFKNGLLRTDVERIPLQATGHNLAIQLQYLKGLAAYRIHTSCADLQVLSSRFRQIHVASEFDLQLRRDRLDVSAARVRTGESQMEAHGSLVHFASPALDLAVTSELHAADWAAWKQASRLTGGVLKASGRFRYDSAHSYQLTATIDGRRLVYRSPSFSVPVAALTADLSLNSSGAKFDQLDVQSTDGALEGTAQITNWRTFVMSGKLRRLDVQPLAAAYLHKPFAWRSSANGPVKISGSTDGAECRAEAQLVLEGRGDNPLAGQVAGSYVCAGNTLNIDGRVGGNKTQVRAVGTVGQKMQLHVETTEADAVLSLIDGVDDSVRRMGVDLRNASARYNGDVTGGLSAPQIGGDIQLNRFVAANQQWSEAKAHFELSRNQVTVTPATLSSGSASASITGSAELSNWSITPASIIGLQAVFRGVDLTEAMTHRLNVKLPLSGGLLSGQVQLSGTAGDPSGSGALTLRSGLLMNQPVNEIQTAFVITGDTLRILSGEVRPLVAPVLFSGVYQHSPGVWGEGRLEVRVDANKMPLTDFAAVRRLASGVSGHVDLHGHSVLNISGRNIAAAATEGTALVSDVTYRGVPYGRVTINAKTENGSIAGTLEGTVQQSSISGNLSVSLAEHNPFHADVSSSHLAIQDLKALGSLPYPLMQPIGSLSGKLSLDGQLSALDRTQAQLDLTTLELQPAGTVREISLRNTGPVRVHFENGTASIQAMQFTTHAGQLSVGGRFGYGQNRSVELTVRGQVGLQAFELLDPNVTASGTGILDAQVHNPHSKAFSDLEIDGSVGVRDGSFAMKGVPNEVNHVNGTVQFDRHHASITEMTGETGGGRIQLSGFLNFGQGPPNYDLRARATGVRIRYGGALSVTTDAALQMSGTTSNGLLSGSIDISRFVLSPEADLSGLLALSTGYPEASTQNNGLIAGVRLDVHVQSRKDFEVLAAASRDIQADVDLRLRGTIDRPLLFGGISARQGSLRIFGAKYSINSGEITFSNPVRIEPVVSLDVQTVARGIAVDITVSGTLNKLNMNYRSDPPLQPRDIIALLTVGQPPGFTPSTVAAQPTPNDVSALQSGASTVLGQAISPASGRLSKLFGITNIKIDPLQQGITNTPQSRLTIEQQISQSVTVTYVTNLVQTSEQIFRFEWALNPQYSVVAVRDDNGEFGIDIQYKKRFK